MRELVRGVTTLTLQQCRSCGGTAPVDVHFCPGCTKILTVVRHGDYFAFLGLPRTLTVDADALEQRYRSLSRQFHPDFYYNATPAERRASLERSSYLNDAYRTLRQSATRVAYLLEIEGVLTAADRTGGGATVPPALLEEVFALNEELDEVRALRAQGVPATQLSARLAQAAAPIEARAAEHEAHLQALAAEWDALAADDAAGRQRVLQALRARVLERHYITNLLASIASEAGAPVAPAR